MTISSLLIRSHESAVLLCVVSGCVLSLTPRALRAWEENLADAAIQTCADEGGIALVSAERAVSCAPSVLVNRRAP
jgi:hypothetical protein